MSKHMVHHSSAGSAPSCRYMIDSAALIHFKEAKHCSLYADHAVAGRKLPVGLESK